MCLPWEKVEVRICNFVNTNYILRYKRNDILLGNKIGNVDQNIGEANV